VMACGGRPSCLIAFLKKALAAATSRVLLSLKSMVCPALSTAR
jgi:hypothetical protein